MTALTNVTEPAANATIATLPGRLDLICNPAEAYPTVFVDYQTGEFSTSIHYKSNNGITFYEYHGFARRFALNQMVDASRFDQWFEEECGPIVARIKAGLESKWNGSNNIAVLDDDAEAAREELEAKLELTSYDECEYPTISEQGGFYEAREWLQDAPDSYLGITAESTEDDVNRCADDMVADAAASMDAVIDLQATRRYIQERVDRLNEEDAE